MAKRPHLSAPAPIGEILAKVLKPRDLRQLELFAQLRQAWEENISESIRQHTRLVDYQRKILYVETVSHVWIQELHFAKPQIMAAMQQQLGPQKLKDIKFLLAIEQPSEAPASEL